ncbi:RHS repeat-associated core domain-containing protein [Pseudomonas sp. SWRI100]|uniref:RHS repeat-associated core domain-containing protein n=1 Tax=Pseudomonas TaxID=286 RepID=UPI0016453C2C|nr:MULTISPECIES: RHS repeat-associated core domain-containing protein [Pseudomonas]MBC3496610.1 RHS repeat-associated core domain-containing protein [Pseudomonas sp. SWRI67]MBV4529743.1 RHS repeat-associated core domain-containing protein [Pseudomonas kermanshahensis]
MKREGTVHYFYQSGKLSSVQQGGQISRSIQTPDIPLAQRNTDTILGTGLLAVENGGSVLRLNAPQKTEVHTFTTYGYDPTLPSSSTVLGFNAERLDTGSESYVLGNGYRVFSPILMRFLSPDSLSPFDDGGINAYAYCSGDPINHLDPSGHAPPGKKNNSAGATTHKVTSAPSPSESPMTLRLNQLKQERAKLELDNPSLKEDKQKVLNYSFNNPGKLKEMHDLIHTTQSKNERTARGHWNSDAAFAQIVDAQVAETNLTSFYNSNPGIQEMYKLHYTTHKLDQKITSLDRKINSLENMIYVIRGSNT